MVDKPSNLLEHNGYKYVAGFRKYLGVLNVPRPEKVEDPIENKANMMQYKRDQHVYDKMLSAYIKGHNRFQYGFNEEEYNKSGVKIPAYYPVQMEYIKKN